MNILPLLPGQHGHEIPNFRINFADENKEGYVAETDENLPVEEQERIARLITASIPACEALKYQEMADCDPPAARRKGYYEEARLRRTAFAKAGGRKQSHFFFSDAFFFPICTSSLSVRLCISSCCQPSHTYLTTSLCFLVPSPASLI
mgnify:CR=1 FL=1